MHSLNLNNVKVYIDKEKSKKHNEKAPSLVLKIKRDPGAILTLISDGVMAFLITFYVIVTNFISPVKLINIKF